MPINDAMVIPLVGLEVTPTRPTMRDDTVTKKKANTTTQTEAVARTAKESIANTLGTIAITRAITARTMMTTLSERSRSVRGVFSVVDPTRDLSCAKPMRKLSIIVGMLFMSVIRPPVATAPAPM